MAENYGPPWWTDEKRAEVKAYFDSTEMCDYCCQRVPKTEIAAGLHAHPAVMD
jgi:hypothetical protein